MFDISRKVLFIDHAAVASSQVYASEAGIEILKKGGNAMDTCITMATVLAATEPSSTGIGGDAFFLYYDNNSKRVSAVNGSGHCGAKMSLEYLAKQGIKDVIPETSGCAVTIPGTVDCLLKGYDLFSSKIFTWKQLFEPAIELAEKGFKVAPTTAHHWKNDEAKLKSASKNWQDLLPGGSAPTCDDLFTNKKLANVFKGIAENGRQGFYEGEIASNIVTAVSEAGGCLTLEDLKNFQSELVEPLCIKFKDSLVYECPPSGQGLIALIALGVLDIFIEEKKMENLIETKIVHVLVEIVKLAFHIGQESICDDKENSFWEHSLKKDYLATLSEKIDFEKPSACQVILPSGSDTVCFCAVDSQGNSCSFINSNYMGFGTAIIPDNSGFTLQNRGCNFSLDPNHPNSVKPMKRPYHTIIPGIVTSLQNEFKIAFGVMGGFMQPQGHVQVLWNMLVKRMNPQEALNHPRFYVDPMNGTLFLEEGYERLSESLIAMGHVVKVVKGFKRALFGRGQILFKDSNTGKLFAGSDIRADGIAAGF